MRAVTPALLGTPVGRFIEPNASAQDVAASLGSREEFAGTDPTCTSTKNPQTFDCELARASDLTASWRADASPTDTIPPDHDEGWVVSELKDRDGYIWGSCQAVTYDLMKWRCYLGTEAMGKKGLFFTLDLLGSRQFPG